MLRRFTFDQVAPDRPLSLSRAYNVLPAADGFRPVKSPVQFAAALPGAINGAAYVSSAGLATLLAGRADGLYSYDGTTWTVKLAHPTSLSWRFTQFGDNVVAVNGDIPVKYNLTSGSATDLGGDPPVSDLAATVRNSVFLAGDPSDSNVLAISGYNDSEGWTAGVNQCIYVPFPSGGAIMGLAGGETGIILQRGAVKRATYNADGVTWWTFDELANDVGCMAKGSVAQAGNLVFWLSEEGFKVCDRNTIDPIGKEKIDVEFFGLYSREDIEGMTCAVDPRTTTVMWAIKGTPGRIWLYDWTLQEWATIDTPLSAVFSGFTSSTSIDGLDGLYPGGIDTIPGSLDSDDLSGGSPLLIVVGNDGTVNTLSGPNMEALFAIKPIEVSENARRVRIRGARVVSDAVVGTVSVDVRARAGDPQQNITSGSIRDNGRVPLRANGRHVGITVNIPAGAVWSYALGLDLEYEESGMR